MIFMRCKPPRKYGDYKKYRPYLRTDFQHRCAYCLRHEGHNGGEANFVIDHYWPKDGRHGRPDLECEYTNLYYACSECNQNKWDNWPDDVLLDQGYRFLDPCRPEDDHDLHWRFHPDGSLESLTNVGKYTDIVLVLSRSQLREWRARIYRLQQKVSDIEQVLDKILPSEARRVLEESLREIKLELEPPIFDRPRGMERRLRDNIL
jgi:hypothetical protein